MKIIFFTFVFISVSLSAQQKEKRQLIPKTDTVRMKKPDLNTKDINSAEREKDLYKIPTARPANDSVYSGMKDKRKDSTDYKILNGITPENKKNTPGR
ncbi:hypothetical protein [Chryseobacterium gregarium]|uniref:hypothetical protein n=1 Tax=Chryseobacterium gregarium TaxID=456299 RepID=UPI00041CD78C|nr:hypothetical protein [Chryseobacterium gregarium]